MLMADGTWILYVLLCLIDVNADAKYSVADPLTGTLQMDFASYTASLSLRNQLIPAT